MDKYSNYKDSGVEWIGEIPAHWEMSRLKYEGQSITGITYSPQDTTLDPSEGILVLRSSNIQKSKLSYEDNVYLAAEIGEKYKINDGDILICSRNGSRKLIGKNVLFEEALINATWGAFMTVFRSDQHLFIHQYFNSQIFKSQSGIFLTSTINQLTIGQLNNLVIALPPKEEQNAIASFLNRKTAQIDRIIAAKEKLIKLYEEEKTAIINKAVTHGIDDTVELVDCGIDWLGMIPVHWKSSSLKWYANIYSGGTPSRNEESYWFNGTIPWLNSGTVNQFFITEPSEYITIDGLENSSAKWVFENSLVMALAGQGKTKGMTALCTFNTTCNQSLGVIQSINKLNPRFLLYYLNNNYQNIRNLAGGDKRDGINLEMIGSIPIPVFEIEEQELIVNFIERSNNLLNKKIEKATKLIDLLTEYRTTLINDVVTGKIKIT